MLRPSLCCVPKHTGEWISLKQIGLDQIQWTSTNLISRENGARLPWSCSSFPLPCPYLSIRALLPRFETALI